ncbi:MAG: amidohydrolase [Ruminococcaceae bacterium]|nr:amidohydrolase [Oscillospiraceae bacterium]
MYQKLFEAVEAHKDMILAAEEAIKKNPELGFREWKTHAYLKARFEELGYTVTELGNIPGFYTDVDTGRPGPKVVVFGELDALPCPGHPLADPETGAAHACGHNCQCAALLGVAAGLTAPNVLDEMSGSIRLFAVPAEEGVSSAFREELKKNGTVRYFAGKPEVLYRGLLDDVDIALMVHQKETKGMSCPKGSNGNVRKKATFIGKSAHAGGAPHKGLNALYAASNALAAANAIRETFREQDKIRMHPIITKGGNVVNAIPDEVVVENMIRGAAYGTICDISHKINRAYAGCAAAMGCQVHFQDLGGSAPRYNDENLRQAFKTVAKEFYSENELDFDNNNWGPACSDMGDISSVIPAVHPFIAGVSGTGHGVDYVVSDPYTACVICAKVISGVTKLLLCDDAAYAKKVIAEKKLPYASKEEFFKVKDALNFDQDGVFYNEDGTVTLNF